MEDLIIVGTGIHALETAEIVERINRDKPVWRLLGYIHLDNEHPKTPELNGYPVLGGPDTALNYPNAYFAHCFKSKITQVPHDRWATIIDPSVFVSRTAQIGRGCIVFPNGYIGVNAVLGDFVFCLSGVIVNHDDVIGNDTSLTSGVIIAGETTIGSRCYIGQGSNIRQKLTIGDDCFIGMGAVVIRDVPPNSVMVGNPARWLRENNPTQ